VILSQKSALNLFVILARRKQPTLIANNQRS